MRQQQQQRSDADAVQGAVNAIFSLTDEEAARGVVTHSSGNHGAAVALAAQLRGITAHVVVPANTPEIKRAAIRSYGVEPIVCEASIDAREAACAAIQRDTGATFVPPYNHPAVISGQGTIALEFLEQVPQLDAIIVPVSGGGMISGIAVAAKAIKPCIKILAAEPVGRNAAADVSASKAAGELVQVGGQGPVVLQVLVKQRCMCPFCCMTWASCSVMPVPALLLQLPKPVTICDGLEARLGSLTWPIVSRLVDDVLTVTEEEVVAAMQLVMERMKVRGRWRCGVQGSVWLAEHG